MEIVGVGKEESSADLTGGSGMILSTQELQDCKKKSIKLWRLSVNIIFQLRQI